MGSVECNRLVVGLMRKALSDQAKANLARQQDEFKLNQARQRDNLDAVLLGLV